MKKMMAPKTKSGSKLKLHLNRETLQSLEERELQEAAGGSASYRCHSGPKSFCSDC
ncbi:MAG TPA: hypothetical protein VIE43_12830 [Thermoanaerobaculia bacterium]|jgi:hypothetical protein|nr:hypothetical protein [Thermoanaerobaculia bacterium]